MKKITRIAKLQFPGGEARPGPNLASIGVNIKDFCNQFNQGTQDRQGEIVPVVVEVYNDKTFSMNFKTTPTSILIKKLAKVEKGASNVKKDNGGSLTEEQILEIAKIKLPDLNTNDLEMAKNIVKGTMKQMGCKVKSAEEDSESQDN